MKLLLETAGTMEWEIIALFDSYEEIDECIKEKYGISFDEYKIELEEEEYYYTHSKEEWYIENGLRIREIPTNKNK